MTTRRAFLASTALGAGALLASGYWQLALAANDRPLIDSVAAACNRLAPLGWRQMMLDATGGELDITAPDLHAQLVKTLAHIDRSYPGFGDFDAAGKRAIEAGEPDRSLLYHAFASPTVVANRAGTPLGGFPTLAEIDAVENYVYGVAPPTIASLRTRAGTRKLAVVVYALQYRNTPNSVHGRHAELCFSRSGIARLGTIAALYDAKARNFAPLDPDRPFDFRAVPQRFAAYLAIQMNGDRETFGPQDALEGDDKLAFWVPVHKLFGGTECIAGMDLTFGLARDLRNDELAQFHRYMDLTGYQNNWRGAALEQFPFTIRNEKIASFSARPEFGPGVLEPAPAPLATAAQYQGKPLTFPVDPAYMSDPANVEFSSMQVLPGRPTRTPAYMYDTSQGTQRPAPEYLNVRHKVLANGQIDDLNKRPQMMSIIKGGNYQTQHYIDFTGDGWIEARCPALEPLVDGFVAAYVMVAPPDFFPNVSQRDLMLWWKNDVPKDVRAALWAIQPYALSQTRVAANIDLPIGFSVNDTTVTAIVSQPTDADGPVQQPNGPVPQQQTGMPDASPGLFDPGWDTSEGVYFFGGGQKAQRFLAGYALGSPFVEDAKLCAALGAYWPGVSPDGTRTYQPDKFLTGLPYPWPTTVPLTDEEIGIAPAADGKYMPWDGVRGPSVRKEKGRDVALYTNAIRADYLDLMGTMTAALTARIDQQEYQTRVMAMSAVYWGLGIHDPVIIAKAPTERRGLIDVVAEKSKWAVRSFKDVTAGDGELKAAEQAAQATLAGPRLYRFEVYRWGEQYQDPHDLQMVYVEMLEQVVAYSDGKSALLKRGTGPWTLDNSMPT